VLATEALLPLTSNFGCIFSVFAVECSSIIEEQQEMTSPTMLSNKAANSRKSKPSWAKVDSSTATASFSKISKIFPVCFASYN